MEDKKEIRCILCGGWVEFGKFNLSFCFVMLKIEKESQIFIGNFAIINV